jgi:hypothetical protein
VVTPEQAVIPIEALILTVAVEVDGGNRGPPNGVHVAGDDGGPDAAVDVDVVGAEQALVSASRDVPEERRLPCIRVAESAQDKEGTW